MPHGVPDSVDVEADPAAVFEAYGAETVDELLASGSSDLEREQEAAVSDDEDVAVALFAEELTALEHD